jgi:hypothetical protein
LVLDPIASTLGGSALFATAGFFVAERQLRSRWRGRSLQAVAGRSPYRASAVTVGTSDRAPLSVRAAALTSILLGSIVVPGVVFAINTLESDGIALSLLPPLACAAAVWLAGWLLLARAAVASDVARTAARATVAAHVALVALAVLHVAGARLGFSDRPSMAYVAVAFSIAIAAVPQALLLRSVAVRLPAADRADRATV